MSNGIVDTQQTYSDLLDRLEYGSSPNFISRDTSASNIASEREATWREAKDRLGIDAIYFVANAPVIYFKRFASLDRAQIAQLHRNVWSQSKVPLLFVILPNDIRIYSGYEEPKKDDREPSRLEQRLNSTGTKDMWQRLSAFTRLAIETGSFWREHSDKKFFKRAQRGDQHLLGNLEFIRGELIAQIRERFKKLDVQAFNQNQIRFEKISTRYANNLIGRSIFALYLQDRNVLQTGPNKNFFRENYGQSFERYTDLLLSHEKTYAFFEFLQQRFNGDIFPVTEEEKSVVQQEHLNKLQELFTVDNIKRHKGFPGQKLFFWAYNFEFVPIELISAIYEEFLHPAEAKKQKKDDEQNKDKDNHGAYYTPPRLVDFVLNQVLPERGRNYNTTILDPTCGSGVFLVEAYRRLVERWRKTYQKDPSFTELVNILRSSIFGVDIKGEALSVASFSLCLALANYLKPDVIWQEVKFPSLIKDGNLIETDFFEKRVFAGRTFDLVVGNPPWESQLTTHAIAYLKEHNYEVGDKQIAQAFLLYAPEFCANDGQVALLCSSKNLLFNRSKPNVAFRQRFFHKFLVTTIFDFSILRNELFVRATAPTVAVFYSPQPPDASGAIFYGAPKLTPFTHRATSLVIDADDIKHLPVQQVWESINSTTLETPEEDEAENNQLEQPSLFPEFEEQKDYKHFLNIWKVALWGTSYDYILLQHLNKYPSLGQILEEKKKTNGWVSEVGINFEGPDKDKYKLADWLDNKLYLDTEAHAFARYRIDMSKLKPLEAGKTYYRPGKAERFKAPLVLFKRTQVNRKIAAAYLDNDCAYTETFTGIAGPEKDRNLLKAITAFLNSEIAEYYLFFTTASWGIEREEVKIGEMKLLPYPFERVEENVIAAIARLVDTIIQQASMNPDEQKKIEEQINDHIYNCFRLDEQQKQHIRETLSYTINFFHRPKGYFDSLAHESVLAEIRKMQESYALAYMKSLNFYVSEVDKKLTSTIYRQDNLPLLTVKFSLHDSDEMIADIQEDIPDDSMSQVLSNLDKLSTEYVGGSIYQRRNIRIYDDGDEILYRIKPIEPRYWTIGAALSDAEETFADLM